MHSTSFSRTAMSVLKRMLEGEKVTEETSGLTKREWREFADSINLKV